MDIVISFLLGLFAIGALSALFSLKTKGVFRLVLNSLVGALIMSLLSLFGVSFLPLNPLSALIVGIAGVPGAVAIAIITLFL